MGCAALSCFLFDHLHIFTLFIFTQILGFDICFCNSVFHFCSYVDARANEAMVFSFLQNIKFICICSRDFRYYYIFTDLHYKFNFWNMDNIICIWILKITYFILKKKDPDFQVGGFGFVSPRGSQRWY